jgi:hypothetical protein
MEINYVDADKMKSAEEYLVSCVIGMISIKTVMSYHAKASSLGILSEDQMTSSNVILYELTRTLKRTIELVESILETLPESIDIDGIVEKLRAVEKTRARGLIRETKKKT